MFGKKSSKTEYNYSYGYYTTQGDYVQQGGSNGSGSGSGSGSGKSRSGKGGSSKNHSYGYYQGYGNAGSAGKGNIGPGLNFAAREAYKQLRTNLDFALPDVEGCRAVGITSAMRGDGKSLTAINLSYSLAEDGYRTILIEGDLRIPTLSKKLGLEKAKGITSILTSSEDFDAFTTSIAGNTEGGRFDVLVAGEIPPNPQEMLGSRRMQELMERIRGAYDYIILDLPPITAVADALVASRYLDGMVVVVRHDHTERGALAETVRQLEFSGVRILGFVFNAAADDDASYSGKYRSRNRYKKYKNYNTYGNYSSRGYGYGYGSYESGSAYSHGGPGNGTADEK